jgi:hypothetical protein
MWVIRGYSLKTELEDVCLSKLECCKILAGASHMYKDNLKCQVFL